MPVTQKTRQTLKKTIANEQIANVKRQINFKFRARPENHGAVRAIARARARYLDAKISDGSIDKQTHALQCVSFRGALDAPGARSALGSAGTRI